MAMKKLACSVEIAICCLSFVCARAEEIGRINISGRDYGYFKESSKWSFRDETNKVINVCWEEAPTQFSQEMDIVKDVISSSWGDNSSFRFEGWHKCDEINDGIRIRIKDVGPYTNGLGGELDGLKDGMTLNFTFQNWSTACASTESKRKGCIKSIAVHEFGHALGFAHEQNRPDTPGECAKLAQGENGERMLTPYDPASVMNYCNPVYNNGGVLSKLDIDSLKLEYGAK